MYLGCEEGMNDQGEHGGGKGGFVGRNKGDTGNWNRVGPQWGVKGWEATWGAEGCFPGEKVLDISPGRGGIGYLSRGEADSITGDQSWGRVKKRYCWKEAHLHNYKPEG